MKRKWEALRRLALVGLVRQEIDEELEFHLSVETDHLISRGFSRNEAERMAAHSFGNIEAIRRECIHIRCDVIENSACEIRSAIRSLMTSRLRTSIAFAGLTAAMTLLAIAFNTFDKAVLDPLPYRDGGDIVRLWSSVPGIEPDAKWGFAAGEFQLVQRKSAAFESMGLYRFQSVVAHIGGGAERLNAMITTDGTLSVLGLQPLIGRNFSMSDILADQPRVALISYAGWTDLYNNDPSIVGKSLEIEGASVSIIGVLPSGAVFPEEISEKDLPSPGILLPLKLDPAASAENHHVFRAIARLKPGIPLDDARGELRELVARLPAELPSAYSPAFMKKSGFGIEADPLMKEVRTSRPIASFILMLSAAALLLTAACAATSRVPVRDKVARLTPLATEMALLVVCAAAFALVVASIIVRVWLPVDQEFISGEIAHLSSRSIAFTLILGSAAAVTLSWIRSNGNDSPVANGVSIFSQTMIPVALLMVTAFVVRNVKDLRALPAGFNADNAVVASLHLPADKYSSHEAVAKFHDKFTTNLRRYEGVIAAGMANSLPLQGFDGCSGVTVDSKASSRCVPVYFVGPGYLNALGVKIQGREPLTLDETAAVVSRSFAAREWPGLSPIGRTLRLGPSSRPYRVVGVADDVKSRGLDKSPAEDVYVPLVPIGGWNGWPPITNLRIVIRTSHADVATMGSVVKSAISSIDSEVSSEPVQRLDEMVLATTAEKGLAIPFVALSTLVAVLFSMVSLLSGMRESIARRPAVISAHTGTAVQIT
jgi:hypothetical protein